MVFHQSLSDSKSLQVSRAHLNILVDVNNVVVWMVSSCPLISKSSSPFTNPLEIVPSAQTTIDIIITFMFHSFFSSHSLWRYLFLFSPSFNFTLWFAGTASQLFARFPFIFFFFFDYHKIRWSVCMVKSQRSLCVSFSRTDSWLCIYPLSVSSNLNSLHNSQ